MDSLTVSTDLVTSPDNCEAMPRKRPLMDYGNSPLSGPSHYPPDDHDSTPMSSGQQSSLYDTVLRQLPSQATPQTSTKTSHHMNLRSQSDMQESQHNTIPPSLATPLAISYDFPPSESDTSLQPTDKRFKRRRQDGGQQLEVQELNAQESQLRLPVPGYKDETIAIRAPTRDQRRLCRRFENNDWRFRYLGSISIIHPTKEQPSCATANLCCAQELSLIHPLALQSRGFIPQELPPGRRRQFLYSHGIAKPQRYIELVIGNPHPPMNMQFRPEIFYVLHDEAPYHDIDIYLGQKFLKICFGENPATASHNIPDGGGDVVGRQAGSSRRGMQDSTAHVKSLAATRTSSTSSQYHRQGYSEPVTSSSRTSRSASARAVEMVAAPPVGAQETYHLSHGTPNAGTTPASGSTTLPAYHVPSFTYTPPSRNEGSEQYSYLYPYLNPCPPVFAPNNPGDPASYLQVPDQPDFDVFSDNQSDWHQFCPE